VRFAVDGTEIYLPLDQLFQAIQADRKQVAGVNYLEEAA